MGYESIVFVIVRREIKPLNGMPTFAYGDEIARFDMCKMGYEQVDGRSFPAIFDMPIDFDLYSPIEGGKEETRTDMYGDVCGMTSAERVIEWLERAEVTKDYRRAKLLLGCLRAVREHEHEFTDDGEIVIVHYGY